MGKCLSCCEVPAPPPENFHYASQSPPGAPAPAPLSLGGYPLADTKDGKRPPVSSDSVLTIGRPPVPPSDRKMFKEYTKIPPIKRQGNGDSKRLSLISRDISEAKVNTLFEVYKEPGEETIQAEGIEHLCQDLEVKPEEFIVLVLAWKFEAETMCRFTREEFMKGCRNLKVDSIKGIQSKFPELLAEVQNKQTFKELYRWAYKFTLDTDTGQRTLPVELAINMWKLIFSQNEPLILSRWLEFLDKHQAIRGIPKDTWDMFLNFLEQVGDDLSSYDDAEAWPSLFDDFVEYENDRQNQNVTKPN